MPYFSARHWLRLALLALAWISTSPAVAQYDDYEGPPINYESGELHDVVQQLSRSVETGEVELSFDDEQGYLQSVLEALEIPTNSQVLVFSKTSMQRHRISGRRPRAIYFNDDVYVGYCQKGEVLELAVADPSQGAIFYTLEQKLQDSPKLVRDRGQCLSCHASSRTQNVPGFLVRSVFANRGGMPEFGSGTFTTDQRSPFKERWGGWYVTGTHGNMRHMGNAFFNQAENELDREAGANQTKVPSIVETDRYLQPGSDIVSLMVLEHQTQMHNAICWANYETRRSIHYDGIMNAALDRPSDYQSDSTQRRIAAAGDNLLRYLLFSDEFQLTSPVAGTSTFADDFEARGQRDSQGRSLRDFDLTTRMFKYPCSYLIHSASFDALPGEMKQYVSARLHDILIGKHPGDDFSYLSAEDRQAILEILAETKPDLWEAEDVRTTTSQISQE